jgi:hypothetical protein
MCVTNLTLRADMQAPQIESMYVDKAGQLPILYKLHRRRLDVVCDFLFKFQIIKTRYRLLLIYIYM